MSQPRRHANFRLCRVVDGNALGVKGRPEDLRGAVVLLASDAGRFITGHNLVVDGGWSVW